jgi:O-acetyl-ADP-ribose deacetylase (regulator of RNase III)
MIQIEFRETHAETAAALAAAFDGVAGVSVAQGDILQGRADAILSPANSFGNMDGGIDLAYARFFPPGLEDRLQDAIDALHDGELPVGQAVAIETQHAGIPLMISAPTMRLPGNIARTVNVYLAFRAGLLALERHRRDAGLDVATLLSPALGTGVGAMPPQRAARQMRTAYDNVLVRARGRRRNFGLLWGEHLGMLD